MSEFERQACKVLGIILFCIVCVLALQIFGCAPNKSQASEADRHYPLIDTRLIVHKYKDNIQLMLFPKDNTKLTQYCSVHFEWEDIKPMYRKVNEEWQWTYQVKKNKKSWK